MPTDKTKFPDLLSAEEKASMLKEAEALWRDLQENRLGGYSGINRPFYILDFVRAAVEKYGNRDTGYHWSNDELDAMANTVEPEKKPGDFLIMKRGLYYRPNSQGYTANISEAGRYSETDAVAIMNMCDPGDISICPAPDGIEVDGAVVPLDVAEAAATAVQKMADNLLTVHPATAVAEAIMAERERCAKIADEVSRNRLADSDWRYAAQKTANLIRKGGEA